MGNALRKPDVVPETQSALLSDCACTRDGVQSSEMRHTDTNARSAAGSCRSEGAAPADGFGTPGHAQRIGCPRRMMGSARKALRVFKDVAYQLCAAAPAPQSLPGAHGAAKVVKATEVATCTQSSLHLRASPPACAAASAPQSSPGAHEAVRECRRVASQIQAPSPACVAAPTPRSPPDAREAVKVVKATEVATCVQSTLQLQAPQPACAPASAPQSPQDAHKAVRVFKATERSPHFVNYVENFHLSKGCVTADDCVQEHTGSPLSKEPQERKRQLIKVYTGNSLYRQMNACLNLDEPVEMRRYSGYIRELRDAFRTDDPHSVVVFLAFHRGMLHRGIEVSDAAAYVKQFRRDEEFMWASFTSTSKSNGFSGNVFFEIQCSLDIDGKKAEYAPASVHHLSHFPKEDEVLFPPHVAFRVVNIKDTTLMLETIEFPSVWGLISARDWVSFAKWVAVNAPRVNTRGCAFSMVNSVTVALVPEVLAGDPAAPPMVHPLLLCLGCQADINEVDPETGALPVLTMARAAAQAVGAGALQMAEKLLRWCIGVGGNIFKKGGPDGQGEAAVDAYPRARELAEEVGREGFVWEYHVDDGVDGKEGGWYPYAEDACPKISTLYDAWRCDQSLSAQEVQSRGDSGTNFHYALDFASMTQTNKSTGKVRRIRRTALQV